MGCSPGELRRCQREGLQIVAAVIHDLLLRDHRAVESGVVGEGRGDLRRAVLLDGAIEKVRRRIEPGFEGRAVLRRDLQRVIGFAAIGFLAQAFDPPRRRDRRATRDSGPDRPR